MAETAQKIVMVLLLLSLTSMNGFCYDITFRCEEDLVCFHLWRSTTLTSSRYIAVVSNGEVWRTEPQRGKCIQQVKDLIPKEVGRHRCFHRQNGVSSYNTAPVLNLIPAKTVTLQCVVLSYVNSGFCPKRRIRLMWVDEAGVELEEDSHHLISQPSQCNITLTLIFESPGNKTFRCQVTMDEQVSTSTELSVRSRVLRRRGKGLFIEPEPERAGGNRGTIGAAVGAVGLLVLTAVVAVVLINRKRRNIQLSDEPGSVASGDISVMETDDVTYANIHFPIGCDRRLVFECESTEYAYIRHM